MGQMLVEREAALREVLDWEAGLQALQRVSVRFSRSESRQRSRSGMARKCPGYHWFGRGT